MLTFAFYRSKILAMLFRAMSRRWSFSEHLIARKLQKYNNNW